ncbi:cytochrome bc complex cytochrome b subunit [Nocardioides sp. DS6]|uniref:Cytochrome bc1 complex cytochrome b subunit n=1 Tax=Nocardioides eburneus TaxID=3231482 RepID=A0ABV3T288_9ACTN
MVSLLPRPRPMRKLDERLGFASTGRSVLAKVFPDHWTFMMGEIALYSFLFLVVSGIYLALFFEPSSAMVIYHGHYRPMEGQAVSAAYASTVHLSWDVRGGLLVRQAHHWAAHLFIASIVVHLCRIFLTGSFRRPRELNWTIGITMLILGIFNAYAGYSLPDDLLSGTGLRIFNAIALSIPVVGSWLAFLVFDGEFPGQEIIQRLYLLHVLLVPAILAVLISAHLAILIRQKHTHFPGPGRRNSNVVGSRVWPGYALRSLSLLAAVFAAVLLAGGLLQINPVWAWGDNDPATITAPSVADWYILWIEGALRLFPPVEFHVFGFLVPNQFWCGVVLPLLIFGGLYLWPWLDRRWTGDRETHHLTGSPRESPLRVALASATLVFLAVLLVAGSEELIVQWTGWTVAAIRDVLRVLVFVLPLGAGLLGWWLAESLRRSDLDHTLELGGKDLRAGLRRRAKGRA